MAALTEEEQLNLALALSASEAEATTTAPPDPPATIKGHQLRDMSETQKWGGTRRVGPNTRSQADANPQNKCHRVENATLVRAYNSTTDESIKREIIKFNMSKDNCFHGSNNKAHTAMENAMRDGTASSEQFNRKADMLLSAISNLNHYKEDYSVKTVAHILKTLKAESPLYNKVVADLKKSSFTHPDIKAQIDEARRQEEGKPTQGPSQAEEQEDRSLALALELHEQEQEQERRSQAVRKGWDTRRRNEAARKAEVEAAAKAEAAATQEADDRSLAQALDLDLNERERRSEAARKGCETRRNKEEAAGRGARAKVREAPRAAEAEAEAQRRSSAALRGWETRRENQAAEEAAVLHQRRSDAALRGWETRRRNQAMAAGFSTGFPGHLQPHQGFTGSSQFAYSGFNGGPTKADGTPDMRFKVNRR